MNSNQNLNALEVENQLLSSSRRNWQDVATKLKHALTFVRPGVDQTFYHNEAIRAYQTLLADEKSTFPSSIQTNGKT